jgi:hypothetical protein
MKAKKGHAIDELVIIKLFANNYARDLLTILAVIQNCFSIIIYNNVIQNFRFPVFITRLQVPISFYQIL